MVRNKFVKIQHGKEIVRKNNILDAYPEHIAKRQMGTLDTTSTGINETDNQFELSTLLLKLDTPLEGLKEMGVNKLNITGEDLEGNLSVVNNGDNSLTINGSLPVDNGTTVEGTSFTLTDADPEKNASITQLEGNTTQNGTPTPSSPVEIKTVSGDNNIVVSNEQHVTGNSYRVDFGGKNKLQPISGSQTVNGITFTLNEDKSITLNGTATANALVTIYGSWSDTTIYQALDKNSYYTISGSPSSDIQVFIRTTNGSTITSHNPYSSPTFTGQTGIVNYFIQVINGTVCDNITIYPQLEQGTVATEYSPYVANPIELCKIGNYVDKLKRAEGKQLFDKDNINMLNGYFEDNGTILQSDWNRVFYIKCEKGTAYTITQGVSTLSNHLLQVAVTTELPTLGVSVYNFLNIGQSVSYTYTTSNTAEYLVFRIRAGDDVSTYWSTFMINLGSTALPYEPYGVGTWYIEKNIGKVVYNGTENWYFTSNCCYTNNIVDTVKRPPNNNTKANIICNHYQLDTLANCYNNVTDKRISVNNGGYLYIYDTSFTSANAIKTWLTTNNVIVYYALATPSYEIITNENLIQQLNNIQDMQLVENLCYVDWVGEEKPTMTLKYNYKTEYEYDLGVQDFTLSANNTYNVNANGLGLKLANNSTIYEGTGTYTPTQDTEVTSAKLLIPLGVNFSSTVYPTVEKQSGLRNTEFDVHYVDSLDISVTNYKCFTTLTKNGCIARYQYTYDRHSRFRSYRDGQVYDMADLNGRRITAIGFACNWIGGGSYQSTREVLAVLDTSNYALYINQEIPMNITRVDEITSDAEFYTNNTEVTGPLHLDPLRTNCD